MIRPVRAKIILLAVCIIHNCLLPTANSFAQFTTLWIQTSNPSAYDDIALCITADATGIYIAGVDGIPGSLDWEWRIEKRNLTTGSIIWSQRSNPTIANSDVPFSITADASGIYVAGYDYMPGAANNEQWHIEKRDLNTGALIAAFGIGGVVTSNPSVKTDIAGAITVDASGIYIAGLDNSQGSDQWLIEKRDLTTGAIIWTKTNNPSAGWDDALAITADASGIYVAGTYGVFGDSQWRIEKRDLNTGVLIAAFGTAGVVTSNPSASDDEARAITIDVSGIYVAGFENSPGNSKWLIEKRDLTTGAIIWTNTNDPSPGWDDAKAITVDASGIYVAGYDYSLGNHQWRIEKHDLNTGAIICTKTNNPSASFDGAQAIVADASGIYVAGRDNSPGNGEWHIEKRDLTTGALIATFGTAGVVKSNPSINLDEVFAISCDATGIYIAGYDRSFGLANSQWRIEKRDLTTGALDAVFGGGTGVITSDQSTSDEEIFAIVTDASGIYLVGDEWFSGGSDFQWRIEKRDLSTGALITTFGTSGIIKENFSANYDAPFAITVDASGIYVAGMDDAGSLDNEWRIEKRDLTTGAFIAGFGTGGVVTSNPSNFGQVALSLIADATSIYIGGYDMDVTSAFWRMEKRDLTTGALDATFGGGTGVETSDPSVNNDAILAMTADANNLYVAGYDASPGVSNYECRIEKRDKSSGTLLCNQTSNPSTSYDEIRAITMDASGIYVAGQDKSPGNFEFRIEKYDGI